MASILLAHAETAEKYFRPEDIVEGAVTLMRRTMDLVAETASAVGVLSYNFLDGPVLEFISDVVVGSGWWTGSDSPGDHLNYHFGNYWVNRGTPDLIRRATHPQMCRWIAKLMCAETQAHDSIPLDSSTRTDGEEQSLKFAREELLRGLSSERDSPMGSSSEGVVETDGTFEAKQRSNHKKLEVDLDRVRSWMDSEGYNVPTLAAKLRASDRAVSSLLNNGKSHGRPLITKLANAMECDLSDFYLP